MPYLKRKNEDGQWYVYKEGSDGEPVGSELGCHTTESAADAQIASYESATIDLVGDTVLLIEKSPSADGTTPIKLIAPGWGSSGYYPQDVLARDGPGIFRAGTQMFWNHPTESQDKERPERDLRDLAAVLVADAAYRPDHPQGPGLYGKAKVFSDYRDPLTELAPHIGVSILASGKASPGEMEGREGLIVRELTDRRSVDFVTAAGAGGKVLDLFESARSVRPKTQEVTEVDEKEAAALKTENQELKDAAKENEKQAAEAVKTISDLKLEVARHQEADQLRAAQAIVAEVLEASRDKLPAITFARLEKSLAGSFPADDEGKLKEAELRVAVEAAVKEEIEYIAKLSGNGEIRGMGPADSNAQDRAGLIESFEASFRDMGFSSEEAKKSAEIAAAGR